VFASVRGGLGSLGESLVSSHDLNIRRGTTALSISGLPGHWRVATSDGNEVEAASVVIATPGFAAGPLLLDVAPDAVKTASAVDYASVALITMVFDRQKLTSLPKGTGFLVPPITGRLTKAATFVSQKWRWVRHLAPNRDVLRFSVGRLGDDRGLEMSDTELTAAVLDEVADLIGVRGAPPATAVTRWNESLPQYRVGHRARVADARATLPAGIGVAGAAWDGIGIPACIASGWAAADAAVAQGTMVT
jgi:oxygen-dependent protoporphyrinogen oxidase